MLKTSKIISDIILIPTSIVIAFTLKFKLTNIYQWLTNQPIIHLHSNEALIEFLKFQNIIIIIWILALYFCDSYKKITTIMPYIDESIKVIKGNLLALLIITASIFFYPILPHSKSVIIYLFLISTTLIIINRVALNLIYTKINKNNKKSYIIIGSYNESESLLLHYLITEKNTKEYIGSICNTPPNKDKIHPSIKPLFKQLATQEHLNKQIEKINPNEIIVTTLISKKEKGDLITFCEKNNIILKIKLSHEKTLKKIEVLDQTLYESNSFSTPPKKLIHHAIEYILTILLIIITSPILIGTALFILISAGKPIIYKQKRIGKNNKTFTIYKFRTLKNNAEKKSGPIYINKTKNPAYIKGGNILRKYSIDELPQLFNILKGEMSLVGPRPERPIFVEKLEKEIPNYKKRHSIKGGITGWAQINGRAFLTLNPAQKTRFDLYYIENKSLLLDLKIILKTITKVISHEESY